MNVDSDLKSYSDYSSLIELIERQTTYYEHNICIHYQLPDPTLHFKSLTYGQVNRIANHYAYEWKSDLQDQHCVGFLADEPVFSLLGMLAIFKLRKTVFNISTRNSEKAIIHMLAQTSTKCLITSKKYISVAQACAAKIPNLTIKILDTFIPSQLSPESRSNSVIGPCCDKHDDVVLITHSSGSTAFPKIIHVTNKCLLFYITETLKEHLINIDERFGIRSTDTAILGYPLFHMFGITIQFMIMITGACSVLFRQLPISTRDWITVSKTFQATYLVLPPVLLEYLAQYIKDNSQDDLSAIWRQVKVCIFSGASLRAQVGDYLLEKGLNVRVIFGSTEAGIIAVSSSLYNNDKQWSRLRFANSMARYSYWESFDESAGAYQYIITANSPGLVDNARNRPNGDYASGDLFVADPAGSEYLHPFGRVDDTLVMKNGEKTNPIPMEQEICNQDIIQACSVTGEGRECTAVLVQLVFEQAVNFTQLQIINKVHEAVHRANKSAPTHSVIVVPYMVYILPLEKKLPTTIKGNVLRKKAIQIFSKEIDQLYTRFLQPEAAPIDLKEPVAVEYSLRRLVAQVLKCQPMDIDKNCSLFHYGLDSLLSIQLRNRISSCLRNVPKNFVFEHSTLASMVKYLDDESDSAVGFSAEGDEKRHESKYQDTQAILYDYLSRIETDFPDRCSTNYTRPQQHTVLLTGATGSLGSFLLREMIHSSDISKIYCLVRGNEESVIKSLESRHIDTSILSSKVQILPMNMSSWSQDLYAKVKNEITLVQLCGWLVDFNQPIQFFEQECIRGLYDLLKFAYRPSNPIHVHVISSISATHNIPNGRIYERPAPQDPYIAMPMGYAQSKYIVEHLFAYLSQHKDMPCFVERTEQLCGDTQYGIWNMCEQYPLMILGGRSMKMMPKLKLDIAWLPVDTAASSILELMLHNSNKGRFYHIVNSVKLPWTQVLHIMKTCGIEFSVVEPDQWVNELSKHHDNPAYRLLPFFEDNINAFERKSTWETQDTIQVAKSLDNAPSFNTDLLMKSLSFWKIK